MVNVGTSKVTTCGLSCVSWATSIPTSPESLVSAQVLSQCVSGGTAESNASMTSSTF